MFWQRIQELVATSTLIIDRPKGSAHPRFPDVIYPLDYGYLEGTMGGDGDGIDVWVGSEARQQVVGVFITADLLERDAEIKVVLGCTRDEIATIDAFHNQATQGALFIASPDAPFSL